MKKLMYIILLMFTFVYGIKFVDIYLMAFLTEYKTNRFIKLQP